MSTSTTPDPALDARLQELLGGCAARDPAALKQLYKLSSPNVVRQRADQYRANRARALTWIVSIARYKAIDLLRRERISPLLVADPSEFEGGADAPDSEEGVVFATEEALLDKCLRLLTTAQRRSLELAFVGGHSHDEVARVIGSPLGTVKSWIRRGLASLRACIESP